MTEAVSNTLQKVSEEFLAEVLAQLDDAKNQSVSLLEAAKSETEAAVSKILETGRRQAASAKRQVIDSAELEARNLQLRALEESVNEAFDEGVRRLAELAPARREAALERLVREGVDAIGPKARISCSVADKKMVASAVRNLNREGAKLTLDDEVLHTIGGVKLESQDGTVRFDNTFEARLERARQELRKDVANALKGGPELPTSAAPEPSPV